MEEKYVQKPIKKLYALARGQLIGRYSVAILVTLLLSAVEVLLSFITGANTITSTTMSYLTSLVITVVVDLLLGILVYGQVNFYLKIARGLNADVIDIFSGFKGVTDKAILVQSVFTAFSVLSLIPSALIRFEVVYLPKEYETYAGVGVFALELLITFLAKLYFGLSFYILYDHPDWSVPAILRESFNLMKKKKGRYTLTYLCAFPLLLAGFAACGIGLLWFVPFFNTLLANFYLDAVKEEAWDPKGPSDFTPDRKDGSSTLDIRL